MDPLVVTLELDDETTARLDAERRELFPPGRTAVGAHLTLFHAVPGERRAGVLADVAREAGRPRFTVAVTEVMSLGRGAAYRMAAEQLDSVHGTLQRAWWDDLTAQDRQPLRAHVTVQNKVEPDRARATVEALRARFTPYDATAVALAVWRYVGGPWQPVARFDLALSGSAAAAR